MARSTMSIIFASLFLSLFPPVLASRAVFTTTFPNTTSGSSLNLTWEGAYPPSNITLYNGTEYASFPYYGVVIDIPGTNGYWLWSIPSDLPTNEYGFYIEDSSMFNGVESYSNFFNITNTDSSDDAGGFVKPTAVVFTDSPTASSWNVSSWLPSTPSAAPKRSGLSAGAKAGIGVGAAVVVLVIVGFGVFWSRKSKSTKAQTTPVVTVVVNSDGKPELAGSEGLHKGNINNTDFHKAELGADHVDNSPPELEG